MKHRLLLAALLGASLLIKVELMSRTASIPLVWDEEDYYGAALQLAEHDLRISGYPGAYRMPGYPYFMATVLWLCGPNVAIVKLAQVLVSVLSAGLLYGMTRELHGKRSALVATAIFSFLPELVGMSHLLWCETLFLAFLIGGLWLSIAAHRTGSLVAAAASGFVWGLGVLVKSSYLFYVPLAALLLALIGAAAPRKRAAGAALFLGAFGIVLLPWLLRNAALYGKFPYLTSNQWINVWVGNRDLQTSVLVPYYAISDEQAREAMARERSLAWIRAQGFWWIPIKLHRNLPMLFTSSNFAIRHMWLGAYGPIVPPRARALIVVSVASYLTVMVLAIAAFVASRWDPFKWHTAALVVSTVALHVVMVAFSRYREPLMAPIIVYASIALGRPLSDLGRALRRPATILLLTVLAHSVLFSLENQAIRDLWRGHGRIAVDARGRDGH